MTVIYAGAGHTHSQCGVWGPACGALRGRDRHLCRMGVSGLRPYTPQV